MSFDKKSAAEISQEFERLQHVRFSDHRQHYLDACNQTQFYLDLIKIEDYPLSPNKIRDFYAAVQERQMLAEEFLNATHIELLDEYSRYNREDLEILSDELCKQIEGDSHLLQALEQDDIPTAPRPNC